MLICKARIRSGVHMQISQVRNVMGMNLQIQISLLGGVTLAVAIVIASYMHELRGVLHAQVHGH